MDVAVRGLAEVGGVGLLAELVPIAGEDAFRPRPLEGDAETTDSAKKINARAILIALRMVTLRSPRSTPPMYVRSSSALSASAS
jgi:hypothetical protein